MLPEKHDYNFVNTNKQYVVYYKKTRSKINLWTSY